VNGLIPTRRIGLTSLSVTELGLGAAPLGNLYRAISDSDAAATLDAALEGGIRFVDTAPYYGFGLSERRVGDLIRNRRDVVISTKAGRLLVPEPGADTASERHGFVSPLPFEPVFDYTREGILGSFDASLQRLGLAHIDILYIHDIGRQTHGERDAHYRAQLLEHGGLEALAELRRSGFVSAIGLGVNEIEICLDLMQHAHFDVLLLAGRYTLLEQRALDELLPRCLETDTSIVVGGPFNSGVLAAGASGQAHYNYAPVPPEILCRVRALEEICTAHSVPLPAAALQFPLAHPAVAAVIPGFSNAAEVQSGLEFCRFPIPAALWTDLRERELIDPRAPTPEQSTEEASK
jgi:D-threo-aldose 1-dehydrogenase